MFDLLHYGVRLGCEFVDMETCWSCQARDKLLVWGQTCHQRPVKGKWPVPQWVGGSRDACEGDVARGVWQIGWKRL